MKFLLFFLGLSFFFIFFLFSWLEGREGIFQNLFFEAQLYVLLSVICILSLVRIPKKLDDSDKERKSIFSKYSFSKTDFIDYTKLFFGQYIYYIGTFLFYVSLFLVLQALMWEIDIPTIFLCFNILVLTLYFFEHKFQLFQDLIRINTLVVSLYYIIRNAEYLLSSSWVFSFIDIVNMLFVFLLFYLFIYSSKLKPYLLLLTSYAFLFTLLLWVVVYKSLFWDALWGICLLSFSFWVACLLFTKNIAWYLSVSLWQIRIWGLLCLYTFSSLSPLYIFKEDFIALLFIVLTGTSCYLLFIFHERFQNYVSLFFSSYSLSMTALWTYGFLVIQRYESYYMFIFCFLLSWLFLIWDKCSKNPHVYDKYFFRSFSIIVNLIWVICFFFFIEVSILKLALLLFGECLYFFYSYYSLRNNKTLW